MADVKDEVRTRLIDEAARVLAEQGPGGLSLRKVAAAAGTSTMAVYTHFGDKQALLAAMYREGFRRLGERLRTASDPDDPLLALGRAYRQAALDSPHLYGLMFGTASPDFVPDEDDDKAAQATYGPLVDGVRAAVAAGLFVGDAERIARHLWVVAHGMVSLELSRRVPGDDADDPAARYDDALLLAAAPFLAPG